MSKHLKGCLCRICEAKRLRKEAKPKAPKQHVQPIKFSDEEMKRLKEEAKTECRTVHGYLRFLIQTNEHRRKYAKSGDFPECNCKDGYTCFICLLRRLRNYPETLTGYKPEKPE